MIEAGSSFGLFILRVLADASWAAALLLGVVWAFLRSMPRPSAASRALAWNLALGCLVVLPISLAVLPPPRIVPAVVPHLLPAPAPFPRPRTGAAEAAAAPVPSFVRSVRAGAPRLAMLDSAWVRAAVIGALASLWLAGALICLGRFVLGYCLVSRWSGRARIAASADWQEAGRAAAARLGLARPPFLAAAPDATFPAVAGFRRPTVFLPSAAQWSPRRKEAVLLHEFAHVRRRDTQVLWLQQIAGALYWFHPAVTRACAEARRTAEDACDDLVLETGLAPVEYAEHLLDISRSQLGPAFGRPALGLLGKPALERRLSAILDPEICRRPPSLFFGASAAATLLVLLAVLAATRPLELARPALPGRPVLESAVSPALGPVAAPSARPQTAPREPPRILSAGVESASAKASPARPASRPPRTTHLEATGGSLPSLAAAAPLKEPAPASGIPAPSASPGDAKVRMPSPTVAAAPSILSAGREMRLFFAESTSSRAAAPGRLITLLLAEDLREGDTLLAKAGSLVLAEVMVARKATPPGRSGTLVIRLRRLNLGEAWLDLARSVPDIAYSQAYSLKWPLGLFRPGDDVDIAEGTPLTVRLTADLPLPARSGAR